MSDPSVNADVNSVLDTKNDVGADKGDSVENGGDKVKEKKDKLTTKEKYKLLSRIIVCGFPSIGIEQWFRNPRHELQRFMKHFHANKYKVYNFCCEPGRVYDPEVFEGRVENYGYSDHCVPPPRQTFHFCENATQWLRKDPENIVVLHCKAGKGRSGMMCCCLMYHLGIFDTMEKTIQHYDATRVKRKRALTVPSQLRYTYYYETLLHGIRWYIDQRNRGVFDESLLGRGEEDDFSQLFASENLDRRTKDSSDSITDLNESKLSIHSMESFEFMQDEEDDQRERMKMVRTLAADLNLYITSIDVANNRGKVLDNVYFTIAEGINQKLTFKSDKGPNLTWKNQKIPVTGDIHIRFYSAELSRSPNLILGFWLNTAFVKSQMNFEKNDFDLVKKQEGDFRIIVTFKPNIDIASVCIKNNEWEMKNSEV
eukprot:g1544.t1